MKNVSPEFMQEFPVVYGNKQSSHLVRGVSASYGAMRSETPQPGGRFLDDDDVRLRRRVAFIGSEVQRKLFGGMPPVGETIRIGGQPFEVVGVDGGEGPAVELQPAGQATASSSRGRRWAG